MQGFIYGCALVLGALILLVDLFVALAGAPVLGRAIWLAVRGTEVTGHVARIRERPGPGVGVRVAYHTPAGTFETGGTSQQSRVGEPMTVRYDPARPARATTWLDPARRAARIIPAVLLVAALSAAMAAGAVFYFAGVYNSLQVPLTGGSFGLGLVLIFAGYAHSQRETSN